MAKGKSHRMICQDKVQVLRLQKGQIKVKDPPSEEEGEG